MKTQPLPATPAPSRSGHPGPPVPGPPSQEGTAAGRSAPGRFARQHRQRMRRADLLTVIVWASVATALALWLADGGLRAVNSLASFFTAAGIVAGLAGMDLVLLMLLLVARIPFIDRTVGHDRALEFHRKLGKPSLYLLLAHGLLLAVGYGMAERLDPVSEAGALWTLVPDMWLAFVSMALFLAVVVTSSVAVRRLFPYEFWYVVHLLTYAAVGTSLPHHFSVGGLFAEGSWHRWYWLAVCIATGAALFHYRLTQPLAATSRHQLTVSRVTGIVDPADGGLLLAGYPLGGRRRHTALATSGSAERGTTFGAGRWMPQLLFRFPLPRWTS
ncbi:MULTISPECIES: ferric reductase-like transmembrane domain-containing protein [unclassified Arthrobacter]|uniref:ferric reductase-like transmembrane domain-containing protein n=1 Tax=unclassified Arthrobacter TaxID=235627 RepID=UPI00339295DC